MPLDHLHRLRDLLQQRQALALTGGVTALGLFLLLFYSPHPVWVTLLFAGVYGLYLVRKVLQLRKAQRLQQQLTLESCFVRHHLQPEHLQRCVRASSHIWTSSAIMNGLQRIFAREQPHLLLVEEKRRRLGSLYHQAFSNIRVNRLNADFPLLLLVVSLLLTTTPVEVLDLNTLAAKVGLLAIALVFVLEVLQTGVQWRLAQQFQHLESALSDWTLGQKFEEALRQQSRKPYQHTLLYEAAPWFLATPDATAPASALPPPLPLREVA